MNKLDILAIGVHPDDVELSCSGTILNEVQRGKQVGILDLTEGELGTRGTVETRYQESALAARILGVSVRENLRFRDGFFTNDEEHKRAVIGAIRRFRPDIVLTNALNDRHPDHGRAGRLVAEACFLAGLSKIITADSEGKEQARWRPAYILHYIQDRYQEPDLIVDITDVFDQRMRSIQAYATQFHIGEHAKNGPQTYISTPEFLEAIVARARMIGKKIGVKYAEGFNSEKHIGIRNLDALLAMET